MTALRPARRMLRYAIIVGALAFAATPSGAGVVSSSQAEAVRALVHEESRGDPEARLQQVHWGRFCRWHAKHRLCLKLIIMRHFCERRPDHRLCDDDDSNRFCKKRPKHPLCDDDRFCKKRSDHPLCDDDQPPSPS
jgi:hypothetical protein